MTPSASLAPPRVVARHRVDSTQRVAFALASEGAPDGTVVVADVQTAGRGRRGRPWEAAPGSSLLASIVRRSRLPAARLPQVSLATAVAVADALEQAAGLTARLKWPNDVVVRERKLAGILLETRWSAAPVTVIGIGINLAQREFTGPLLGRATSVWLETGRVVDRDRMLAALLAALDAWHGRLEADGFAPVRASWVARADTLGRTVTIGETLGTAVALDEEGALVLETAHGRRRVWAGEARLEEEAHDAARH